MDRRDNYDFKSQKRGDAGSIFTKLHKGITKEHRASLSISVKPKSATQKKT